MNQILILIFPLFIDKKNDKIINKFNKYSVIIFT
jgi:hypothetical protein